METRYEHGGEAPSVRGAGVELGDVFRRIVEGIQDYAIFMLDPSGRVTTWNMGAQRIKGYSAAEVIGTHFSRFYPPEEVARGKPAWALAQAAKDGRVEDEGWRVRKDGTWFWGMMVMTAIRDDEGSLCGFAKVTRDITERKHADEERERLLLAQEAVRARDEFLAIASHELKTPITALQLQVQSLLHQAAQFPGAERVLSTRLDLVLRQAERLTRLIDGFADVVRVNTGSLDLSREPLDLAELVRSVTQRLGGEFARARSPLRLSALAPVTGRFDRVRMEQVVASLLANAVKYGAGKPVEVVVRAEGDRAVLTVCDHGIGIPPEFQSRVFDRFARAVSTRHYGGFGLGLWMVVQVARAHGGSVQIDSAPGEGARVEVELPRATDLG